MPPGYAYVTTAAELRKKLEDSQFCGYMDKIRWNCQDGYQQQTPQYLWLREGETLALGALKFRVGGFNVTLRSDGAGATLDAEQQSSMFEIFNGGVLEMHNVHLVNSRKQQVKLQQLLPSELARRSPLTNFSLRSALRPPFNTDAAACARSTPPTMMRAGCVLAGVE